jgi:uncharacterized membrane protein
MIELSHLHFLPLPWPLFAILVGIFIGLIALLQIGVLQYAYLRLGIGPKVALWVLFASLVGSYFNLPVARLPEQRVATDETFTFLGMRYVVPVVVDWPGTVIAVNVGGALIPSIVSIYLIARNRLWVRGPIAVTCVAAICHYVARPVSGLGITLPVFVPALVTAGVALLLSRQHAAPVAYIGGTLGTLIGADLLNLGRIRSLGAPMASIGGAGTFDGIFMIGVVAVVLASLEIWPKRSGEGAKPPSDRRIS